MGGGYGALPYIRRGLRIFFRPHPRLIIPYVEEEPYSGQGHKFAALPYLSRALRWHHFRRKLLGVFPPPPVWSGSGYRLLPYISRRLRVFGRPKHNLGYVPPLPIPPVLFNGGGTYALPYCTRKPRVQFRPRHLYVIPAAPPPAAGALPFVTFIVRRLRIHFRPKHRLGYVPPLPIPPVLFNGAGTYALPYCTRKPRWQHFQPKHRLGYTPAFAPIVVTPPSIGGGISGGYFSRGRWHDLKRCLELERLIALRALELKQGKRRTAMSSAARAAAEALREAERLQFEETAHFDRLTRALESAVSAKKVTETLRHCRHIEQIARAYQAYLRQCEDEEDAIELLL